MLGNVRVLHHDRDDKQAPKTFYEENKLLFQDYNKQWRWVFKTVNTFEATQEELLELSKKRYTTKPGERQKLVTKRNIPFIKKLNAIFADLDFAKKWDNQTREQKEEKRKTLIEAIEKVCEPSIIVNTSNGIQPLRKIKDLECNEENQKRYRNLIEWVIERSKQYGWAWDQVKDITRILRAPWYYHMKADPYMVTAKENDVEFEFQQLRDVFSERIPTPKQTQQTTDAYVTNVKRSKKYDEVERLDFQEIIKRAFASIGRSCEFDREKRVILDGRLTGTFQGKQWDMRYLSSSSHEPFRGNTITSVADILQVTNKEAFAWICEEFNIKSDDGDANKVKKHEQQETNYEQELRFDEFKYTRWTKGLDNLLCTYQTRDFNVIMWESSSGKTEYTYFQARQNAKHGIKTIYFSLEMPVDRLLMRNARKYAGIREWTVVNKSISDHQRGLYIKRREELNKHENLLLVEWENLKLSDIIASIEKYYLEWYELFYIDNVWYIVQDDDRIQEQQYLKWLSRQFKELTKKLPISINLIHHFRQWTELERKKRRTIASSRGTGKFENDVDHFVIIHRAIVNDEKDLTRQQMSEVKICVDKGRERGSKVWTVYFYKWSYMDECPYVGDTLKPF